MFLGHFAVAFAAKAARPKIQLGVLFIAAQFLDLLWPTLLLTGTESVVIDPGNTPVTPLNFTHYPISHSLLMVAVWSLLLGGLYLVFKRNTRDAMMISLLVLSHWILDLITHRADLPLYPGDNNLYGFGLWNHFTLTLVIESLVFLIALYMYFRATTAITRKSRVWIWVLILLLLLVHFANYFGPPPPDVKSIAWAGQLQWLFVILAWFADKKRRVRTAGRY